MAVGARLTAMRKCKGKCDGPKMRGGPIDSITKPRYNPKAVPKINVKSKGGKQPTKKF